MQAKQNFCINTSKTKGDIKKNCKGTYYIW